MPVGNRHFAAGTARRPRSDRRWCWSCFPLLAALVSLGPVAYRLFSFDVTGSVAMKILVVQGAGMNMRGKTQTEIFGTMTLDQYNQHILQYARELDIAVEIFHSNIEGEVINRIYEANDKGFDGALFNPA